MAIRRASKSSISTTSSGKRFNLIAGYSPAVDEMDLIERVTVGAGGQSSIVFSSIAQTYKHLHLRVALIANTNAQYAYLRFNTDTGNNYAWHNIYANGSSISPESSVSVSGISTIYVDGTTYASVGVIDILDYTSSTKNKTVRRFTGREFNGSGIVDIGSGLWMSTSAINSISLTATTNSFKQYSTAALYGVVS